MGQSYKIWMQPVLITGWVVLAGGCAASNQPPPQRPSAPDTRSNNGVGVGAGERVAPQRPSAADKRYVIAPELLNVLHVVRVLLDNPPETYLKIQVTVQNMTDAPQSFSYRIDWFDKEGERLQLGPENAVPWMLLPREVSSVAVTAPVPTAVDFGIAFIPVSK
jgi:hypothetical protein